MISLFIMIVLVITLVGIVGYTIITLQRSADLVALTQRNVIRMDTISYALRAAARPLVAGEMPRLPVPEALPDGRSGLPRKIVGDDHTPWGGSYGYCPLAPDADNATGSGDTTIHGGSDYSVSTSGVTALGVDYVTATFGAPVPAELDGSTMPTNILGFVVAPSPNAFDLPHCDEIQYRDGAFIIAKHDGSTPTVGGTAVAVLLGTSSLAFMSSDMDATLFVSSDGTGSGATADDPISLSGALAFWHSSRPRNLTLELADGEFNAQATDDLEFTSAEPGRSIRFVDASPTSSASTSGARLVSSTPRNMDFGVDVQFDGVYLAPSLGVRVLAGARARVAASTIGHLRVDGGDVTLSSNSAIVQAGISGSPIEVASGSLAIVPVSGTPLQISSDQTAYPAFSVAGGTLTLGASVTDTDNGDAWKILDGGRLVLASDASGAMPKFNDVDVAVNETVSGSAVAGNAYLAQATCSTLRPYAVKASCTASGGFLNSSRAVGGSSPEVWECEWASGSIGVDPIPAPSAPTVSLDCSANPQ